MIKFFKKIHYFLYLIFFGFVYALPVRAADTLWDRYTEKLETAAGVDIGGYSAVGETTLAVKVGMGISALLGLVGTIFLVLVIYGGLTWMLARGNEDKITKAKTVITNASVGLGITLAAYIITRTIVAIFV